MAANNKLQTYSELMKAAKAMTSTNHLMKGEGQWEERKEHIKKRAGGVGKGERNFIKAIDSANALSDNLDKMDHFSDYLPRHLNLRQSESEHNASTHAS